MPLVGFICRGEKGKSHQLHPDMPQSPKDAHMYTRFEVRGMQVAVFRHTPTQPGAAPHAHTAYMRMDTLAMLGTCHVCGSMQCNTPHPSRLQSAVTYRKAASREALRASGFSCLFLFKTCTTRGVRLSASSLCARLCSSSMGATRCKLRQLHSRSSYTVWIAMHRRMRTA